MLLSDKTTYIYGLFDPVTTELRYVGKTVKDPEHRLRQHINAANAAKLQRVARWIRGLLLKGSKPECTVIEEVSPKGDWQEAECFWIEYYKSIGANLVNTTDGGEGCSGFQHNDNFKDFVRVRNSDPAFIAKCAAGNTGKTRNYTHVVTDETRQKLSLSNLKNYQENPARAEAMSIRKTVWWADNDNKESARIKLAATYDDTRKQKYADHARSWMAERKEIHGKCVALAAEYRNEFLTEYKMPANVTQHSTDFWKETEQKLTSALATQLAA